MIKEFENKKIGLVLAMEEEAAPIMKALALTKKDDNYFEIFENESKSITLCVSGIGVLNASLAANHLINNYHCDYLINFGCCGYTGSQRPKSSIFSVTRVYKRDVDLRLFGYERYQYPGMPVFLTAKRDETFPEVDLYTSDEFVGPDSDVPDNVIVDMEAYSVAFVCNKYNIPCRIYKSISDITTDNKDSTQFDSNLENAVTSVSDYIISILN